MVPALKFFGAGRLAVYALLFYPADYQAKLSIFKGSLKKGRIEINRGSYLSRGM